MGRDSGSRSSNGKDAAPVRGRRKTRRTVKDFYAVALKEAEQAALDALDRACAAAPVNPAPGMQSYGGACAARASWIAALPRVVQ